MDSFPLGVVVVLCHLKLIKIETRSVRWTGSAKVSIIFIQMVVVALHTPLAAAREVDVWN